MLRVVDVVVVVGLVAVSRGAARLKRCLVAAPAVEHHDGWKRAFSGGRERHVHIERNTVERWHSLGQRRRRAEANTVLRRAGMPEGSGLGEGRRRRDKDHQRGESSHPTSYSHTGTTTTNATHIKLPLS